MTTPDREPTLSMQAVTKRFGGVVALDGVDLAVHSGEVHALIGENGAGKSTLMKVLSGAHQPDTGTMLLDSRPFLPTGPLDARNAGVAMIYQELNLAGHLTVEQNIMLGQEPSSAGVVHRDAMRDTVREVLALLEHPGITPQAPVSTLGPGPRQLVEIARALVGQARVLVMDEPTSSLSRDDTLHLFDTVRRLRDEGVAIIYISHFLEEVADVADTFTVLRDGRVAGSGNVADVPVDRIIEMMVGRRLEEVYPVRTSTPGRTILSLNGLAGTVLPRDASLDLRRGEILGIAGLVGSGRTELLRTIFGLDAARSGSVRLGTTLLTAPWSPGRCLALGMGMLSEDRKEEGLAMNLSLAVNTTLSDMAPLSRWGLLSPVRQAAAAGRWIDKVDIRCTGPDQVTQTLSGGNQQKVALARLLHHDVDVLLLDEPTRGIDVGSKVQVYSLLDQLAASGKAILLVSSYIPELLGICNRIAVMHRGTLGPARPVEEWDAPGIMREATMGRKDAA